MQPATGTKSSRHQGLRGERAAKGAQGAGGPKAQRQQPGWALTEKELEALSPAQRRRHLLFGDLLEDGSGMASSVFPRDSIELGYRVADPRSWTQPLETLHQHQDRLLGVLKAAEARGRVRALRLRYTRMRAEEIALLIQRQKTALAAIRLELFLPPQLKPTRIPDPLNRQEVPGGPGEEVGRKDSRIPDPSPCPPQRRRVEAILEEPLR